MFGVLECFKTYLFLLSLRETDTHKGWHFHVLNILEMKIEVYVDNEKTSRKYNKLQIKPSETYRIEMHGL